VTDRATRLLLVGGGHAHIEVLRQFARAPEPGVEIVLVSPESSLLYSGMLPGVLAGHYSIAEAQIALPPLATQARARFVRDRIVRLDLDARVAMCAGRALEPFDILSLDVGASPDRTLANGANRVQPVRPLTALLKAWEQMQADAAAAQLRKIAVVGGGAGGVELLLAMHYRLAQTLGSLAPRFALVTDLPHLVPGHPPGVQRRLETLIATRADLHLGSAAAAIAPDGVVLASGTHVTADHIVVATGAAAPAWLADSGLACDTKGFVRIDSHLQSISHRFVFAVGDCAAPPGGPLPKSGVYAVREGPPLAVNLGRMTRGLPLSPYRPQRNALALITTGGRHAIASRPPLWVEGDWVWRWKDRIDRRLVARYT
jgi:selenide, water dikinase